MKRKVRLTESDLHNIIKESVNSILNEISLDIAKSAYYKAYDNELDSLSKGEKVSSRKQTQRKNLYNHLKNKSQENINLQMPVIIVGGEKEGEYTMQDIINNFEVTSYVKPFESSRYKESKIVGYPRIYGYLGPMWDGDKIRYESQEAYDMYSI
jgi:hypothetical protein